MLIGESPPRSPRLATLIITSEASTHLALLELSVPCWEERIDEASESKHTQYKEIVVECRAKSVWVMMS